MNYVIDDFTVSLLNTAVNKKYQINIETVPADHIPLYAKKLSPLMVGYEFTENDVLYCPRGDHTLEIHVERPDLGWQIYNAIREGRDLKWIAHTFSYNYKELKKIKEEGGI